jgi:DNA polymerase I
MNILEPHRQKILLIDLSHLFFRAFYGIPRTLRDPEGNPINAVYGVASMTLSAIESRKPEYLFAAKDRKEKTLRAEKFDQYKAKRPPMDNDLVVQLPIIDKLYSAFSIPVHEKVGYEGDDILATIAEKYRGNPSYQIEILTGDEDAFQLAGENIKILSPTKKEFVEFGAEDVFLKKGVYPHQIPDFKGLAGDNSDNLKGVPGIGKEISAKLLKEFGSLEAIFLAAKNGHISRNISEKLLQAEEIAFFTREMAILHKNVALDAFSLENSRCEDFCRDTLGNFFEKINAKSLIRRVEKLFPKQQLIKNTPLSQSSLF